MDILDNPLELCGFAFIEFVSTENGLDQIFETIGFTKVAKHKSKKVYLWRQGNINIILNYQPESYASFFYKEHGPSACAMGFRTRDAAKAFKNAIELGAEPMYSQAGPMELNIPAIKGIGGMPIFLVDRDIYENDFIFFDDVEKNPRGAGLNEIDHLTHNVYKGRMDYWANFYEKIFNFQEIRYFDIKGEYTGLTSKALTAPDGMIRIPLNEDSDKGNGQIAEFLADFNGVDGSEGGTGAAPIEFSDYIGTPLREGLRFVHNTLVGAGLRSQVKIVLLVYGSQSIHSQFAKRYRHRFLNDRDSDFLHLYRGRNVPVLHLCSKRELHWRSNFQNSSLKYSE